MAKKIKLKDIVYDYNIPIATGVRAKEMEKEVGKKQLIEKLWKQGKSQRTIERITGDSRYLIKEKLKKSGIYEEEMLKREKKEEVKKVGLKVVKIAKAGYGFLRPRVLSPQQVIGGVKREEFDVVEPKFHVGSFDVQRNDLLNLGFQGADPVTMKAIADEELAPRESMLDIGLGRSDLLGIRKKEVEEE